MDEGAPNSDSPSPTLGDMDSVDNFLRPPQKNKIVGFLIGFFLPIVVLIVVLLILSILYSTLGEPSHLNDENFGLALLIMGLGLLSCLILVPITSAVILI